MRRWAERLGLVEAPLQLVGSGSEEEPYQVAGEENLVPVPIPPPVRAVTPIAEIVARAERTLDEITELMRERGVSSARRDHETVRRDPVPPYEEILGEGEVGEAPPHYDEPSGSPRIE